MLERLEIEAFLTLAEELHFGRTADRLHVTTGRISQTIKKLERRIGAPLFERNSRLVRLTPIGQRLHDDLRPACQQIEAGLRKAAEAARGSHSVLRVGFVGAAAGQLMARAAQLFAERHPGCRARLRELQIADGFPRLRAGDVDLLIVTRPHQEPGMANGPVLFSEPRMLAVSSRHPLARRRTVSMEDLTAVRLLQVAQTVPGYWRTERTPALTPAGHPVEVGPGFETFQEALTLIGADQGAFVVGAQATRYYARSDIVYIPLSDAPPLEWIPTWLAANTTTTIHSFNRAAQDAAARDGEVVDDVGA
ncbi:LysR family transcriptional regulator [Streptomyces sp. SAJ15]|uniref:LysR family transcriptional regulator n=1 Tax=Streptomyces sp. SAJ15 TaxID=2011095 RepID=UPI001185E6F3|nr:LysR family transcriptional regulator [Streptomyces sp. SAJ15]TVL91065.1 LysR family transcriptional regulator [Streptomyces sp. SAJ15]